MRVPLRPRNDAAVRGVAVLTPARDEQKTRLTVALGRRPRRDLTVEIAVGSCRRPLSLQPHTVLGTMSRAAASWRFPGRLASLLSAPAVVVLRAPRAGGGPIAACGPSGG